MSIESATERKKSGNKIIRLNCNTKNVAVNDDEKDIGIALINDNDDDDDKKKMSQTNHDKNN